MNIKEQIKILDNKIRQNQADYDLYRQHAKISALSSGKLDKYEYLTGEDLGCRPDLEQKAKFEYSPLGQVFNKGLDSNEKQEGLFKRLKNIEDKTDNQLDLIRDQENRQLDLISKINTEKTGSIKFENEKSKELRELTKRIKKETKVNKNKKIVHSAYNKTYNFNKYTDLRLSGNEIYEKELSLDEAQKGQKEMLEEIEELEKIIKPERGKQPTEKNKESMEEVVENERQFHKTRNDIINVFRKVKLEELEELEEKPHTGWFYRPKSDLRNLK